MLDEEPTLLNKGAKPFKFIEKEKNIKDKKKIEPCCKLRTAFSTVSIDYNFSQYINYRKFIPYYMRFVDPYYGFVDYNVAINSITDYGCCLRRQVDGSVNLELLNLEEIFNVFVPNINISNPLEVKY